jgi:hypothetical protein
LHGLADCPAFETLWDAYPQITPEVAGQMAKILSEAKIDEKTNEAVLYHLHVVKEGRERLSDSLENESSHLWTLLNSAFIPTFASTSQPETQI